MTLIEIVVAMAILTVILGILTSLVWKIQELTRRSRATTDIYDQSKVLFDIIGRDLQCMVTGGDSSTGDTIMWTNAVSQMPVNDPGVNEMRLAFVTSSGIGLSATDTQTMVEVGYCLNYTDSTVTRYVTAPSDGTKWDFYNDSPVNWAASSSWGTAREAVIAEGVRNFTISAYSLDGTLLNNRTDTVMPAYFTVDLELYDARVRGLSDSLVDQSARKFSKNIFVSRGN